MGGAIEVGVRRGDMIESVHRGAAVICDAGGIREAWGDGSAVIYPRSSCKMIQALPLAEAGVETDPRRLALACASHQGSALHAGMASDWLRDAGWGEGDLRCGAHMPYEDAARDALIRDGRAPDQTHNNCSGKHAGFLALNRSLGGGPDYVEVDHPVQRGVRAAFEDVTGMESPTWAVDGCSAPNFATRLDALAGAMARFATAGASGGVQGARGAAMIALREAMAAHPGLVAGDGRACTELMAAAGGGAALKTGAEGVFVAILPALGLGVALKIADGATRASEAAIAAILVRLGVLDAAHPAVRRRLEGPIRNWRGIETGRVEVTL